MPRPRGFHPDRKRAERQTLHIKKPQVRRNWRLKQSVEEPEGENTFLLKPIFNTKTSRQNLKGEANKTTRSFSFSPPGAWGSPKSPSKRKASCLLLKKIAKPGCFLGCPVFLSRHFTSLPASASGSSGSLPLCSRLSSSNIRGAGMVESGRNSSGRRANEKAKAYYIEWFGDVSGCFWAFVWFDVFFVFIGVFV